MAASLSSKMDTQNACINDYFCVIKSHFECQTCPPWHLSKTRQRHQGSGLLLAPGKHPYFMRVYVSLTVFQLLSSEPLQLLPLSLPSIDPCSDRNNRETPWGAPRNNLDLQRVQSDKVICFTSIGTCQILKVDGANCPRFP